MNRTSHARFGLASVVCPVLIATLFFSSCKKEVDDTPPENPAPQSTVYNFPITDGSYWVYQHERTDPNGNIINVSGTDSVYVDGDTVIGLNTYKKIRTFYAGNIWVPVDTLVIVRDSAGYIVDEHGKFIEHDNFTDTLAYYNYQNTFFVSYFMRHPDSVITVPAGTFTTIDYESHAYCVDPNYQPSPRISHEFYADGVGLVSRIAFWSASPDYLQRRLLRYHIN